MNQTSPALPFLFVLVATAASAVGQQFVPLAPLAGDGQVVASAGNQAAPAVARGGGATLAVWEDDRSSRLDSVFGGEGLGVPANIDVFGVLLDAAGRPVTTAPIAIAAETWDQRRPRVAWNGSTFLVVFESTRPTALYRSAGIYGVRVAANGQVLDAQAFRIDDDPDVDEGFPAVAAIGGRWLVAWSDVDANGLTVLRRRFVDAAGVVGPAATLVAGAAGLPPSELALAGNGTRVAVAWSVSFGNGVQFELYDANGVRQGGRIALAAAGGKPAIGTRPQGFYVAWQNGGFVGTPIDDNGVVAVPGGSQLAPIGVSNVPALAVAFDGGDWIVAYPAPPSVFAVRVATTGLVGATTTVTTSPAAMPLSVSDIAAIADNGSTTVLWTDRRFGLENIDSADVFGAALTATGVTAAAPVSVSVPAQVNARIAEGGPLGYLIVYQQQTSGVTRIMTRIVDAAGVPLLPEPEVLTVGDRMLGNPAVAWNGSEYLVTWGRLQTTAPSGPPPLIEARRCDILGRPIDPAPIVVMEGTGPAVAAIGSTFLVAALYRHVILQYQPAMRCRRVDGTTGALLDPAPQLITVGVSGGARVVAFADRWLVTFSGFVGAFVLADGTPQPPFQVGQGPASVGQGLRSDLVRSAAGDEALLLFEHSWAGVWFSDVHARRIRSDGTSSDPLHGVPVSALPQSQLRPVAAALDDGYLCLWADHRDSLEVEPGIGDVFAARLPLAGAPRDPAGLPVFDTAAAEGSVAAMRTGRGTALVAASVLTTTAGAHRIVLQQYRSASVTPWSTLGAGIAGTYGVPQLEGFGELVAGAPFDLTMHGAPPNALAVTGLGVAIANLPLLGGVLVPQPLVVVDARADAAGKLRLGAVMPPGLAGVSLFAQTWILDPAAVQGVAATPGVRGNAP